MRNQRLVISINFLAASFDRLARVYAHTDFRRVISGRREQCGRYRLPRRDDRSRRRGCKEGRVGKEAGGSGRLLAQLGKVQGEPETDSGKMLAKVAR